MDRIQVKVRWQGGASTWHEPNELDAGFRLGWSVQDIPVSTTRMSLGTGVAVGRRKLGERQQILVQIDHDGRSIWLPYENLRRIKDVGMRYERTETSDFAPAKRFHLRLLAHALENWNHLTGALDRLDVDPLPHQIQLVHRILSSGNYNWLIADDVGLGKTIEVGLLLAALKRKRQTLRVLVVAPAGLTRQWQDELRYKFDQHYRIYGRDFWIKNPEHWKLYDQMIVSLDTAKREDQLALFSKSPGWDIIIFDEGHKLTRHATGERTERYRLAEVLRRKSDSLVLLSGTPHQGYADRFTALLELVRPDMREQIHTLEANPEIVRDLILRNRKSVVTDNDGNFLFHGQQIHRVAISPSQETIEFQRLLHSYLKRGYRSSAMHGTAGRAIGFVMTTYRKLSSSSIAAIECALHRRLERLTAESDLSTNEQGTDDLVLSDLVEGGDDYDDLVETHADSSRKEFFKFERDLIRRLLCAARDVKTCDEKLQTFLNDVVAPLVSENKKLVIFTEYRATQSYLKASIDNYFHEAGSVELINGSMTLDEKIRAIAAFNNGSQFLISTEAGGEGINLHMSCHVMVNYDLPWNPARLVQRIGRLYRYGQSETVVVFNLHARDSFDNNVIDLMLQRVSQIVRDMAPVGAEYNERLHSEILGEVLDTIDLPAILQSATDMQVERAREEVDAALERATSAKRLQDELFTHVAGYDPGALSGTQGFTMQHVELFVRGMLGFLGISIEEELYGGEVLVIRLPENMRGEFSEFGQRTVVRVTCSRRVAQRVGELVLLDFETTFFQRLIEIAKSQKFGGFYAATQSPSREEGALAAFKLRWQNDQGELLTEEFVTLFVNERGSVEVNPAFVSQWLVCPMESVKPPASDRKKRKKIFGCLLSAADRRLSSESTRFKHPNGLVPLAAADCSCSFG